MEYESFLDDPEWKFDWETESEKVKEDAGQIILGSGIYDIMIRGMVDSANRRFELFGYEWIITEE
jgi:hypothetical protein